jgi:hypothetical protein
VRAVVARAGRHCAVHGERLGVQLLGHVRVTVLVGCCVSTVYSPIFCGGFSEAPCR